MSAISSYYNFSNRISFLEGKVLDFKNKLQVYNDVSLSIAKFDKSACAQLGRDRVKLPSWFLFRVEDIPARFRVTDFNDPRLGDVSFLNDFAAWYNSKITDIGLSAFCRPADLGHLQRVILLMRDPEKFEKAKDFVLGHELAHLAHHQKLNLEKTKQIMGDVVSIGGFLAGVFVLSLAIALIPVVQVSFAIAVTSGIVVLLISGVAFGCNRAFSLPSQTEVEEEKSADLDSVNMLRDASGGIYYFDTLADRNLRLRGQHTHLESRIDSSGNNIDDTDHPLLTDRSNYLRHWQAQQA